MKADTPVAKFGKFLVENLRDKGIDFAEGLLNQRWKAPELQETQTSLEKLSAAQKEIFIKTVTKAVDNGIHDFLFALQSTGDIQILVDGQNIVDLSDGINGEAYSDDGWYSKFSKYSQ